MKVAMIAPPWLPVPPEGYGGVENVLAALVPALERAGVSVTLFTVGETTLRGTAVRYLYEKAQYAHIHERMYDSLPIPIAHTLFAFNTVREAGDFDIIHSHNAFIELLPALYADGLPPVLHTLHGPPFTSDTSATKPAGMADDRPMWREVGRARPENLFLVGISAALMADAPRELAPLLLPPVYNGVDPEAFPFQHRKDAYYLALARVCPEKGQAIAARICRKLGYPLQIAGVVGNLARPAQVHEALADPASSLHGLTDFQYFRDQVAPCLDQDIRYIGDVSGQAKLALLKNARALLAPIQWDEPFGMTAIEALACGTPVVAMARGALPEIIKHGVNGFLARDEEEFEQYVQRVDDIDPTACRQSVTDNFSADHMARQYIHRYEQVLRRLAR